MYKFLIVFLFFFSLNSALIAKPNNGGGGSGVKDTCELSGGAFTGSEAGNWACCWSNWGCYGCYNGNCGMTCRTQKCRDANASKVGQTTNTVGKKVLGLSPPNQKAPVAPFHPNKSVNVPKLNRQ